MMTSFLFYQIIGRLRQMDDTLTYGQICRVIKDVNSEIRQDRKESVGRGPSAGQVGTACNYAHGASCSAHA